MCVKGAGERAAWLGVVLLTIPPGGLGTLGGPQYTEGFVRRTMCARKAARCLLGIPSSLLLLLPIVVNLEEVEDAVERSSLRACLFDAMQKAKRGMLRQEHRHSRCCRLWIRVQGGHLYASST